MKTKHLVSMTPPPTGCPIGTLCAWMGESGGLANISSDWLIANGGSLQKALYSELFAVIGYTYGGSGDYFNLPNLTDGKFLEYRTDVIAGIVKQPGLPNITARYGDWVSNISTCSGAFYKDSYWQNEKCYHVTGGQSGVHGIFYMDASRSSTVYGRSNTVQPYSMTVIPIIKVK